MAGDGRLNLFLRGFIEQRGSVHTGVDAALDEVARLLGSQAKCRSGSEVLEELRVDHMGVTLLD